MPGSVVLKDNRNFVEFLHLSGAFVDKQITLNRPARTFLYLDTTEIFISFLPVGGGPSEFQAGKLNVIPLPGPGLIRFKCPFSTFYIHKPVYAGGDITVIVSDDIEEATSA